MKEIYSRPTIEILTVAVEEGACTGASGTEQLTQIPGTWNTYSNF